MPGYLVSLPAGANGTVAPSTSIRSAYANFGENFALAYDTSGRLWVASCLQLAGSAGPVLAFGAGSNGSSVTPAVAINGAGTGLSDCQLGVTLDSSHNVYVSDIASTPQFPGGQIAVFGAGTSGNVAPIRRIAGNSANLHSPAGLAIAKDSSLLVADTGQGFTYNGDVQIFAPGADGNVVAGGIIVGSNTGLSHPFGVALDVSQNVYVTNPGNDSITVYAAGARNNATPIRTIAGSNTGLTMPSGIAVDSAGYVYVGNENGSGSTPILVFAPGANGNATPVQSITINATGFSEPSGIAIH